METRKNRQRAGAKLRGIGSDFDGRCFQRRAVSGQRMRSLAPDMTSEVVLSASEGGDGESGHLALQGIERIRGWKKRKARF